jgi:hypothetical protein
VLQRLVGVAGGVELFNTTKMSGFQTNVHPEKSTTIILKNWEKAGISEDALSYIMEWHKELESLYPLPDGSDPSPGYPDYEQILGEIIAATKGAKRKFLER